MYRESDRRYARSPKGRIARRRVDKKRGRRRTLFRYGLTEAAYTAMLNAQYGLCAACERPETRPYKGRVRHLSVDHCHITGKVRGLLCYGCNSALGFLDDKSQYVELLLKCIKLHER